MSFKRFVSRPEMRNRDSVACSTLEFPLDVLAPHSHRCVSKPLVAEGGNPSRQLWGLVLVMALLASGCQPPRPSLPQPGPVRVTWLEAAQQELTDYDEFVGRTDASETVEVRSRVSGFIKSINFRDGDLVTQGQQLFKIEPDTYQAIQDQSQ